MCQICEVGGSELGAGVPLRFATTYATEPDLRRAAPAADAGAHVTLAVPIEMQMRHGTPPIQKALGLGMSLSRSTDVECTMTADMFTQMRGVMILQRMFANELALQGKEFPKLMSVWDALSLATMGGAKGLKLESKTGSLTPGKEANITSSTRQPSM